MIDILLIGIGIFVGLCVWFIYLIHTAPLGEQIPGVGFVQSSDDWMQYLSNPDELLLTRDMQITSAGFPPCPADDCGDASSSVRGVPVSVSDSFHTRNK